jgi:hypothetical protein
MMLMELRKVIPSFLRRVDIEDRGIAWSRYMAKNREAVDSASSELLKEIEPTSVDEVSLIDWDPDGERKMLAAMLYSQSQLGEAQLISVIDRMSSDEKISLAKSYVGDRSNRRHRPGRALERLDYRFDILSDYGGFRDMQRHRLLTIDWQSLTPYHGYEVPEDIKECGLADKYVGALERSKDLYEAMIEAFPEQASYAVSMAYRIRYVMQFNAREALHMLELRSQPQGHPNYRRVAQAMYRQISNVAGHNIVSGMFNFMDLTAAEEGRLQSERSLEDRRENRL